MPNILLGKRPEHFAPVAVKFKTPDGRDFAIQDVVFKYRTRKEFAALVDSATEQHQFKQDPDAPFQLGKLFEVADARSAKLMAESLVSWGIDASVTPQTIEQLIDETPAAFTALWDAYSQAARDGRLGN